MKARILDNNLLGGYYTEDFLLENKDKEINGSLVSKWVLTDKIPNNLIKPIWNGIDWIESITQKEIDANLLVTEENEHKSDQEKLETKGLNLYQKTKNRLIRRNKKGLLTKLRAKKVREILHPVFLMLNTGDIDLANDYAVNPVKIPTNSNADIEAELVWFKTQLTELLADVNNLL